jgi:hypothetical protein
VQKNGLRAANTANTWKEGRVMRTGRDRSKRLAGVRRRTLIVAVALMAPLSALGLASPALAEPKGIFSVFKDCPVATPGLALCQFAQTTSGEFAIGSTKVPINQTITLQGGAVETGKQLNEYYLIPAKDGNSLSKTELNVPGGLLNLINCEEIKGGGIFEVIERGTCKAIFENKTTGVTATTEIVATTTNPAILDVANLFFEENLPALILPVRVHLKNPLLGESCYIGSAASPIQLRLTTGTTSPPAPNKPIKGKTGTLVVEEEKGREVDGLNENSLVDNAFSVPVTEGCGGLLAFLLDPIINNKLGLPSPSGHNTAILNGSLKTAEASAVIESEKW